MNKYPEHRYEAMKQNLPRKQLEQLFGSYCRHQEKYYTTDEFDDWQWKKCNECTLCKIPYYIPSSHPFSNFCTRDVCFAIWHDHLITLAFHRYYNKRYVYCKNCEMKIYDCWIPPAKIINNKEVIVCYICKNIIS